MGKPYMSEAVVLEGADPHLVPIERTVRRAYGIGSGALGILRTHTPADVGRMHTLESITDKATIFTRGLRKFGPGIIKNGLALRAQQPSYGVELESISLPAEELDTPVGHGQVTETALLVTARGGHTTEFAVRTVDRGDTDEAPNYTVAAADILAIDPDTMNSYGFDDYNPSEQLAMQSILRRVMDETGGAIRDETSPVHQEPLGRSRLLKPIGGLMLGSGSFELAERHLPTWTPTVVPAG